MNKISTFCLNRLCLFVLFFWRGGRGGQAGRVKKHERVLGKVITPFSLGYRKRIRPYNKITFYVNLKSPQKNRRIRQSYPVTPNLCIYLCIEVQRLIKFSLCSVDNNRERSLPWEGIHHGLVFISKCLSSSYTTPPCDWLETCQKAVKIELNASIYFYKQCVIVSTSAEPIHPCTSQTVTEDVQYQSLPAHKPI